MFDLNSALDLLTAAIALSAAVLGVLNRKHITQLHVDVNSRLSQLVASEHAAGFGEGVASERAPHPGTVTVVSPE
jgi:hypothetical protein